METVTDGELIDRCCRKDASAWSEFVGRFSRVILWAIRDRLRRWGYHYGEQDVEDIYQEIMISFWEKGKLNQIREREHVIHWLIMVSGNTAVDYLKRKRDPAIRSAVSIFAEEGWPGGENPGPAGLLASREQNPDEALLQKELERKVETVIDSLPPGHQAVVTLFFLYEKKHREIAETLKISVNTVSTIVRRTKRKLRRELVKLDFEKIEKVDPGERKSDQYASYQAG